jgi:hypothetical protein
MATGYLVTLKTAETVASLMTLIGRPSGNITIASGSGLLKRRAAFYERFVRKE